MEVKGKFYITETAKYRFAIRGRHDVALFLSFDEGLTYKLGEKEYAHYVTKGNGTAFPLVEGTYVDTTEKLLANTWVYFKAVMIVDNSNRASFIGVGTGKIPDPLPQTDSEGNPILGNDGNPLPDIPAGDSRNPITVSYASAYRLSYQFAENRFKPDYFYKKQNSWSYKSDEKFSDAKQTVVSSKYSPWDESATYNINNLFDGDESTYIHTNRNSITEANPFEVVVKLDKEVTANRLTFFGSAASGQYRTYLPRNFKVWISSDGNAWKEVANVVNARTSGLTVPVQFSDTYTFSYYKTEITDTHASPTKYLALSKIALSYVLELSLSDKTFLGTLKTWAVTYCGSQPNPVMQAYLQNFK